MTNIITVSKYKKVNGLKNPVAEEKFEETDLRSIECPWLLDEVENDLINMLDLECLPAERQFLEADQEDNYIKKHLMINEAESELVFTVNRENPSLTTATNLHVVERVLEIDHSSIDCPLPLNEVDNGLMNKSGLKNRSAERQFLKVDLEDKYTSRYLIMNETESELVYTINRENPSLPTATDLHVLEKNLEINNNMSIDCPLPLNEVENGRMNTRDLENSPAEGQFVDKNLEDEYIKRCPSIDEIKPEIVYKIECENPSLTTATDLHVLEKDQVSSEESFDLDTEDDEIENNFEQVHVLYLNTIMLIEIVKIYREQYRWKT